jgi:RNA polymerase-binding transcription factor
MTTRHIDSGTQQAERYAVLKTMLEDRRREIQDKLRSLREALPEEMAQVRDNEEQSVNDFVRDVDFALMQMKSDTLVGIDEALHRLEEGTYGLCADCESEIPEARLKALPFATRCRQCQEQVEAAQQEEDKVETPALGARLQQALALAMEREARHE